MRIGSAQIRSKLGAFKENSLKILDYTKRAKEKNCDLVVFPELCLFGYWPGDLMERRSLINEQQKYLDQVERKIPKGIKVILGAVTENPSKFGKLYYNSAVLLEKGKKRQVFNKELLPNYDVFDEDRFFERGDMSNNLISINGKKVLITICEDIWASGDAWVGTRFPKNPLLEFRNKKVDLVINLSASPYSQGKLKRRMNVIRKSCEIVKAPMLYTNLVGGQDEVIFDGGSLFVNRKGEVKMESLYFEEDLNLIDIDDEKGGFREQDNSEIERVRSALILGLRSFVETCGLQHVHLGISGGIDSAVVACLAADAVGPQNVSLIAMPGPYSADESLSLAKKLAENIGAHFYQCPINTLYELHLNNINESFGGRNPVTKENLQARHRAVTLMAFSNEKNSMLLSTSNKSEMTVGYSTLYGDMCGGIAPIGDLAKTKVYELANHYNRDHELIPKRIIEREPTAELRENQKDTDSLPPYEELDQSVKKIVEECRPATTPTDKWVLERIYSTEFKRWQAPPVLRVTGHAFGRGRRYPIAHIARK